MLFGYKYVWRSERRSFSTWFDIDDRPQFDNILWPLYPPTNSRPIFWVWNFIFSPTLFIYTQRLSNESNENYPVYNGNFRKQSSNPIDYYEIFPSFLTGHHISNIVYVPTSESLSSASNSSMWFKKQVFECVKLCRNFETLRNKMVHDLDRKWRTWTNVLTTWNSQQLPR